jgi:hypothetical protein
MNLHKIKDDENDYIMIFINKTKNEVEDILNEIQGLSISAENFSKFCDFEKIIKEFDIKDEELNNELGLNGAIYNRIALKDLK